jgi:predicted ATPase
VESTIELEQAGALTLKGKSEPVKAWWAIEQRTDPSRQHALGMLRAPTIGRDVELKTLREALERTVGNAIRCLIVAPPGVGKSRLVDEFAQELARTTNTKLWVTRMRAETAAGYDPIRHLLRNALDDVGMHQGDREKAERFLETMLAKSGRTGLHAQVVIEQSLDLVWPEGGAKREEDRGTLFTSWIAALDALSENKPAVWIVEDLHWASPDVIAFLEFSTEQQSKSGRLILTTARPSFLKHLLTGLMQKTVI